MSTPNTPDTPCYPLIGISACSQHTDGEHPIFTFGEKYSRAVSAEQGVRDPAPGLRVEAVAEDGLVEAFSLIDAPAFTLAVQWHPEWQWHPCHDVGDFPFYRALLGAFGEACTQRRCTRDSLG